MPLRPIYDRPEPSEHPPFYAGYIAAVPQGELVQMLEHQIEEFAAEVASLPEARGAFAYAPGKWTIKEMLGHVADAERVFAYRALRIARADPTPLPSFDENAWVPQSGAGTRTLADLLEELRAVRTATVALLRHLPAEAPTRQGNVSGKPISVRAIAWIIAGHERHHLRILRERYLG